MKKHMSMLILSFSKVNNNKDSELHLILFVDKLIIRLWNTCERIQIIVNLEL